jgi:hypothetical protein
VAQTLIRLAAGVGAVVAVTVTGGLDAAVASAHPDGHGSASSPSRDGGHSRGHGRGSHDGRRDRDRSPGPGRTDSDDQQDADEPTTSAVAGRGTSQLVVAQTSPTSSLAVAPTDDTPAAAAPAAFAGPAVTSGGGSSGGGSSGLAVAGRVTTPVVAPRVTFGDGRSPGLLSGRPQDLPAPVGVDTTVVQLAPVLPVEPPAAPLPPPAVLTPIQAPAVRVGWSPETPVASFWGHVETGWPAGVIFGIAGLLLAPIGGIWLGQRQARATRAASQLVSR